MGTPHDEHARQLVALELHGTPHECPEGVDLLLPRALGPFVGLAEAHIAVRRLALERRDVHADGGPLGEEAGRAPDKVEVATHAGLVRVDDDEVKGPRLRLRDETLERVFGRTGDEADLRKVRRGGLDLSAHLVEGRGVDVQGHHLAVRREDLGHAEAGRPAEGADLQHAVSAKHGAKAAQRIATVVAGGPRRLHLAGGLPLGKEQAPVRVVDGLAQGARRGPLLRPRPGRGPLLLLRGRGRRRALEVVVGEARGVARGARRLRAAGAALRAEVVAREGGRGEGARGETGDLGVRHRALARDKATV
mmetsp:Transcript_47637/g.146808  ORF Transcript_47637/g.146808 Transcript_47637/m.146808 type:complete len:306 (-) Transcript_47637:15-932(-)